MTRDPRTDPQPGDEVRIDGSIVRRVLKREGSKLLIENFGTGFNHFWVRVDTWQKWCETSGAEVVSLGNQEE
jgi:hypothetical protein